MKPAFLSISASVRIITVVMVFSASAQAWPTPSFMGLGDLPGDPPNSVALAVSADGQTVVGIGNYSRSNPLLGEPFRWNASYGLTSIGYLPGPVRNYGEATAASSNGSVIVGGSSSSMNLPGSAFTVAFRWTEEQGMVALGDLPGGIINSMALGVSDDGNTVVGWGSLSAGIFAFRWTPTTGMVGLGDLPGGGQDSMAVAVSANGSVIVGNGESTLSGHSRTEAFRWTQATGCVGLGDLPGGSFESKAYDVSQDGNVVVGWGNSNNGVQAFRWTAATGMVGLGYPVNDGERVSAASAVSADGSIIVGTFIAHGINYATIWDSENGMRHLQNVLEEDYGLDLTGWHLRVAMDVSADGTVITGFGIGPSGYEQGWIAIVPEPGTLLFITCMAMLVLRKAKGRR